MTQTLLLSNSLASETGILAKAYAKVSEAKSEYFNIFSILNIETDEVKTHSTFLAELLNPLGSHGMGEAFLQLFLNTFEIKNFDAKSARTSLEYYIGKIKNEEGGRIDILIKSKDRAIVIENKIYAGEQENQLLRYHNAFNDKELFFLTLNGDLSNQHNKLKIKGVEYTPISYGEDILDWLGRCLKEAASQPPIRETIHQYINLIKKLTGQNINQQMNEEIIESILADDQRFEGFAALMGAAKEIRKTILRDNLIPLLQLIAEEINSEESDVSKHLKVDVDEDYLLDYNNNWKSFNFKSKSAQSKGIKFLRFEFAVATGNGYNKLIYGITLNNKELNKTNEQEIRSQLRENFKEVFGFHPRSGHGTWVLKAPFEEYKNWNDWTTLGKIRSHDFRVELKEKVVKLKECIEKLK